MLEHLIQLGDAMQSPEPSDTEDFLEGGKWKCIECGACCLKIGHILPRLKQPDSMACSKLAGTRCSIYADRPLVCRAKAFTASQGQEWDERMAAAACSHMRRLWR